MINPNEQYKIKFFKESEAEEKKQWLDKKLAKGYQLDEAIPDSVNGEKGERVIVFKKVG
jgi:hypothetical protein